uniref:Zinc finger PHD-type domain-containing protein n=1 Tax=Panagrolaimus davidi TaxID=227884 RepID=A0A914PSN8_9BILA
MNENPMIELSSGSEKNELRQSTAMPLIASDDSNTQNKEDKPVCTCGKIDKSATLIYCFGPKCPVEWYHFECVEAEPEGIFYCCDNCEKEDRALGEKEIEKQELAKSNEMNICICKKERNGGIIKCSKKHCKVKQYHLKCVGIKQPPLKPWNCSKYKEKLEAKEKKRNEECESALTGARAASRAGSVIISRTVSVASMATIRAT